jgi:transposase-like protein
MLTNSFPPCRSCGCCRWFSGSPKCWSKSRSLQILLGGGENEGSHESRDCNSEFSLSAPTAALERSPSELNRGMDSRIGFDLLEDCRRAQEAAGMALSDDLRERVVGAVVEGGMSRNAAAKRFGVSIASAVRWVARFRAKGEISPSATGGDRRSGRIEADRQIAASVSRPPCFGAFSIAMRSLLKIVRACRGAATLGRCE